MVSTFLLAVGSQQTFIWKIPPRVIFKQDGICCVWWHILSTDSNALQKAYPWQHPPRPFTIEVFVNIRKKTLKCTLGRCFWWSWFLLKKEVPFFDSSHSGKSQMDQYVFIGLIPLGKPLCSIYTNDKPGPCPWRAYTQGRQTRHK